MRVHLRGVVIGVGVLLSIVLIVSLFNAYDSAEDGTGSHSRNALSMEGGDAAGPSSSRMSPRSSTRLRAQGGPGGKRPGGPGARPGGPGGRVGGPGGPGGVGGRMGGPGGRAGGPGARAGGVGGVGGAGGVGARMGAGGPRGGKMGGAMARGAELPEYGDEEDEDEDEEDFDETPTEDVEEEEGPPRGRTVGAGGRSSGRLGSTKARGRAMDDDDEMLSMGKSSGGRSGRRRSSRENSKEKAEKEKEEKKEEPPKKKEPQYPEWWKTSYARSAVYSVRTQFVGDQPLFSECPTFEAGSAGMKVKRYGPVDPPNYMRNSKNPCWFEWNGKKDILKCVPYFYIAGVPKAGTSDLFNRVRGHPSVMAGGSDSYFWWDRLRYGASKILKYTREAKRSDDTVSLKEYAKVLVSNHGKNITKELLYLGKSESIFGDASPTYMVENTQWDVFEGNEGCSEPRVIPASFIRHMYPDARIIILLRDPIERVYSRFLANVPYVQEFENATASLFHTFTAQAVLNYRQCFSKTSVRHCAYNATLFSNAVIRLSEGMYSVFLEDWFRIFPREQILILKYEDYVQDLQGHIQMVFDHLGLDPLNEYSMLKLAELPVVRRGREREEAGFMMAETVALLKEFYSPFLVKLADMLDDEKWLFPKTDIPVAAPRNVDTEEEDNNEPPASQAEPEADKEEEAEKATEEEVEPKEEEPEKPKSEEEGTTEEGGEDI